MKDESFYLCILGDKLKIRLEIFLYSVDHSIGTKWSINIYVDKDKHIQNERIILNIFIITF